MVPKRKDYGSDLSFSDLCVSAFSARYLFKTPEYTAASVNCRPHQDYLAAARRRSG